MRKIFTGIKIKLATTKDIFKVKSIVKKIDTKNFSFSNKDTIKKHIEKGHYYLAIENNRCCGIMGLVLRFWLTLAYTKLDYLLTTPKKW